MLTESEQQMWNSYRLLRESVTYQVPNSPKVLMSDFYMLAYLDTIPFDALIKIGNINALRFEEDFKHDLIYAQSVLYPFLKQHLMNALFFAMCAEIRHMFDLKISPEIMAKYGPYIQAYHKYYRHYGQEIGAMDPRKPDTSEYKKDHRGYQDSYAATIKAMKQLQWDGARAVSFMRDAFRDSNWQGSYGGEPWANIADSWLKLYNTRDNDFRRLAVYIDHVYDLQHNTDTVFNKLRSYYDGGYAWLKQMLDFKANLKDIRQLMPTCSSLMQKLARPLLKISDASKTGSEVVQGTSVSSSTVKITKELLEKTFNKAFKKEAENMIEQVLDCGEPEDVVPMIKDFITHYPHIDYKHPFVQYLTDMISDFFSDGPDYVHAYFGDNIADDFSAFSASMKGKGYTYISGQWRNLIHKFFNQDTIKGIGEGIKPFIGKFIDATGNDITPSPAFMDGYKTTSPALTTATVQNLLTHVTSFMIDQMVGHCAVDSAAFIDVPSFVNDRFGKLIIDFAKKYPHVTADHKYVQHCLQSLPEFLHDMAPDMERDFKRANLTDDFSALVSGMKGGKFKYTSKQWATLLSYVDVGELIDAMAMGLAEEDGVKNQGIDLKAKLDKIKKSEPASEKQPLKAIDTTQIKKDMLAGFQGAVAVVTQEIVQEMDDDNKAIVKTWDAQGQPLDDDSDLGNLIIGQISNKYDEDSNFDTKFFSIEKWSLFVSHLEDGQYLGSGGFDILLRAMWNADKQGAFKAFQQGVQAATEDTKTIKSKSPSVVDPQLVISIANLLYQQMEYHIKQYLLNKNLEYTAELSPKLRYMFLENHYNPFVNYCMDDLADSLVSYPNEAVKWFKGFDLTSLVPSMNKTNFVYPSGVWLELLGAAWSFDNRPFRKNIKHIIDKYASKVKDSFEPYL